jgi:hypothetical protein
VLKYIVVLYACLFSPLQLFENFRLANISATLSRSDSLFVTRSLTHKRNGPPKYNVPTPHTFIIFEEYAQLVLLVMIEKGWEEFQGFNPTQKTCMGMIINYLVGMAIINRRFVVPSTSTVITIQTFLKILI